MKKPRVDRSGPARAPVYRRPSGPNEDGAPTVRNLLPWRDMEKKLAERLAAKAAAGELDAPDDAASDRSSGRPFASEPVRAPDSGVRVAAADEGTLDGPLTFSVYTVADLEARRPLRMGRDTTSPSDARPASPSGWAEVARSISDVLRATRTWLRAPSPRPRWMDLGRVPLQRLATNMTSALRVLPWKKIGIGAGVGAFSVVLLAFVVLTAAELTDDLAPARASKSPTATQVIEFQADPEPAPPEPVTIELEDVPPAAAPAGEGSPPAEVHAKRTLAKKAVAKKKRPASIFNP